MQLDEALAVVLYLKKRSPGDADQAERMAYSTAWSTICEAAAKQTAKERDRLAALEANATLT